MEYSYLYNGLGRRTVKCFLCVLLFLLSDVFLICIAQYASDPFLVSPQDTVAVSGSTAVLRCALQPDMKGAIVLWSHYDPGMRLSFKSMLDAQLNSEMRNRVSIIGQQSAGEFNLRITNVRETDAGRYECRAMIGLMNIVRRSATLTVVVPPAAGYPRCSMQPPSGLVPGQMVILTCLTKGGKPPTRLTWHRGPHRLGTPTTSPNVQRHTLTPSDYGVVFECRESGDALQLDRSCIVVPLTTYLSVDITPRDPVIRAGETETFGCNAQGAMSITYSWYINGVPFVMSPLMERFVVGGNDQLITVYNAMSAMDNTLITCVATANTGQTANASTVLSVVPRRGSATLQPGVTAAAPSTTRPSFGFPSGGPDVPPKPGQPVDPGRPGNPNRPGGPGRPEDEGSDPDDEALGDDSREDDEDGEDLKSSDRENDGGERENLAGNTTQKTATVIAAAMAGLVISVVIVATVRLMTRVKPGTKDTLITITASTDSEEINPNSLSRSTNRNTFNSIRSTISCEVSDHKRIAFSDLHREYDLPPFEPDDTLSYLGLRPESMISTRYMYEGLHSDTSTSMERTQSVRYYEISSEENDNSLEYEDVVSEQASFSDSALRPMSILTDDGSQQQGALPVPEYNSRVSISNRGRLL